MDVKYSLIQACKENPEEDTPRLILADWLEEHGDAPERDRAEFLRLVCQRARLGRQHPDEASVLARIHDLLLKNREHWLDPILSKFHPRNLYYCNLYFRNGLPVAWVNAVDNDMPWLTALPADLAVDPVFAWLEGLEITTYRPDDLGFVAALRDPRTTSLAFLKIDNRMWTGAQWDALSAANPLLRVRSAHVDGHPGEDYGRALANCPIFEKITALNVQLGCPPMDDAALEGLARSRWLSNVRYLKLAGNSIGPQGVRALATSPHLGELRKLHLACNPIGNEGVELLAQCSRLRSLNYLDLRRTAIDSSGIRALASSQNLGQLTFLSLAENNLDLAGANALSDSAILARVRTLSLGAMSDLAAKALAASRQLREVQSFELSLEGGSTEALGFFGRSAALPELRHLSVDGNTISQQAFEGLVLGKGFKKLESLRMNFLTLGPSYCVPNPERVRLFLEPEALPSLRSFDLSVPDYDSEVLGEVLGTSTMFRRLRRLALSWADDWKESMVEGMCRLVDEGNLEDLSMPAPPEKIMKRLAGCRGLEHLIRLKMWSRRGLRQRSLQTLITSPHLSRLALLDLSDCKLGTAIKVLPEMKLPALRWLNVYEGAEQDKILSAFFRQRPDVYLPRFRFGFPWSLDSHETIL